MNRYSTLVWMLLVSLPFGRGAPALDCAAENGDTNGDGRRDISDAVYSLSFQFLGGPAPVPICPSAPETICDDLIDDDADRAVDCADSDCFTSLSCLPGDGDADGFSAGEGDCDDADPSVNPGAHDFPGNGIDDDCDGSIDPPGPACDMGLPSHPDDPMIYALAAPRR